MVTKTTSNNGVQSDEIIIRYSGCRDVLCRWDSNPILTLEDIPFEVNTVFNAGAVKINDEYLLLLRVENLRGRSIFVLARSSDGYHFKVDSEPAMTPTRDVAFGTYERRGIEDPRITFLEGTYYIMYTAYSKYGSCLSLAQTDDFCTFNRLGIISQPDNKDGTLFPRKIKGKYVRMDRPSADGGAHIWISYSDDLLNWGQSQVLMSTRGGMWDADRIGASVPPIETPEGWLEVYHGVKNTSAGPVYRLGAALLDLDEPTRVISRSPVPILSPREYYERVGDVDNVVFSCGAIVEPDGEMKLYYGAADTCICLGLTTVQGLLDRCLDGADEEID